jgi:PAS domain S-box-containing protein
MKKEDDLSFNSEEITRLIINAALDAIICIDTKGLITVWNPQAEKIFGWKEAEVTGKLLADIIIPLQSREKHIQGIKHYLASGIGPALNKVIETTGLNRLGDEFPIALTIVPIRQKGTEFFCGFIRDITEQKRMETIQANYAEALRQKNIELEQFTYVVSHDLQEPLRTVSSFAELLQRHYKKDRDENVNQYIRYITEASDRMRKLVQDLLDYSRLGRERKLEQINCNEVMKEVLSDLTVAINESMAVIQTDHLPTITGYRTEIKQLFQNLLSNSLKFKKPQHAPAVHVTARRNGAFWQFAVTDNGIGIEKRYWDRVFVIFQRLHTKQEYEGTGIGLAHCKKITELHEGSIWLQSAPGEGTTFYFTIKMNHTDTW